VLPLFSFLKRCEMHYILNIQFLPEIEKLRFENLNGKHFVILLIFVLLFNVLYFAYRIYKTHVENKKFGAIYRFIENQGKLNENWDKYIKSLTERFIREAPPDQIRVVMKLLIDTGFKIIIARTKTLIQLNGIHNRNITEARIKIYVGTTFDDVQINLDLFMYQGKKLSSFLCLKWLKIITEKVTSCVYGNQDIEYLEREFEDLSKQIKLDFYSRMNGKSVSYEE
jgi:hypothetical protein